MAEVTETLLINKLDDGYNRNPRVDDFVTENELTVTITLAEYRKLIKEIATKEYDIKDANKEKWERANKINTLEKKVSELDKLVFEYRKKFGELDIEESEE